MMIALAAAGYSLYRKNVTNKWPWESTTGSWFLEITSNGESTGASFDTEADARAAAANAAAQCPNCTIDVIKTGS